jgi:hypothetical protein
VFSEADAVSSLILLRGSKPAEVAGVEKIQTSKLGGIPLEMHFAIRDPVDYPAAMNELIESGDSRAKVVGKRRPPPANGEDDWKQFDWLQRNFQHLWGGLPFQKEVHRFKSMEKYDEWKTTLMMRNAPGRR